MLRIKHLLNAFVLLTLSSYASFSTSQNPTMDKSDWVTHCFGRFLIDLPPQTEIKATYDLWGDRIKALDDTPAELAARINKREQELKNQQHKKISTNMFLRRLNFGEGATGLLSWSSDTSTEMYRLETYVISKPTWKAYRWTDNVSPNREDKAIEISSALARNLRSREANEIPDAPGFCIDRAYIAGNEFQSEDFRVDATFALYPGAQFEFISSTGAEADRLLDRGNGAVIGASRMISGIDTLRARVRSGPIPADEYLLAISVKGQRLYTFAWEAQGKDESITEPNIIAALRALGHASDENESPPAPTFKSDKEALTLWDRIIDTIRLRPTSAN